jgi:hypothetical protein
MLLRAQDCSKSFKEVQNVSLMRRPRTSVNQTHTKQIDSLIRYNRRITIRELTEIMEISVGSVESIITRDELSFSKFIAP